MFELASQSGVARGLASRVGAIHQEAHNEYSGPYGPHGTFNPGIALFSLAWLKLYGGGETFGVDWHSLVYGTGADSLCGGGDGTMDRCEVYEAANRRDAQTR
mmetsp:Transcript_48816/g.144275  ORF Transcript_48816/g.144275 Transcript_48816/m.144275 type:complete len:102 (-) Transcript_48816:168-473(-)